MKKTLCLMLALCMALALPGCGKQVEQEIAEWTRQGSFTDEKGNFLSVSRMDDSEESGWYVGCMLGEDAMEDSWGGILKQEGNILRGTLPSSGTRDGLTVSVSAEGEDGLVLSVDGGEAYRFKGFRQPESSISVNISTEGWGFIAYAEGEEAPEIDPEYPFQSARISLTEPAVYTLAAWTEAGYRFVKWTKDGEDFSEEPEFTAVLDESGEYTAVFEEDPDWQSPAEDLLGEYRSGSARAQVDSLGLDEVWLIIDLETGERESVSCLIIGQMDADTLTVTYEGASKTRYVYDEDGAVISEESIYEDGTGTVAFHPDGTFTWQEDLSENEEDMVFSRTDPEAESF